MGSSQSKQQPAFTDDDMKDVHHTAPSKILCPDLPPLPKGEMYEFQLPEKGWKKTKGDASTIQLVGLEDLDLQLISFNDDVAERQGDNNKNDNSSSMSSSSTVSLSRCILVQNKIHEAKDEPLAVLLLQQPQGHASYAQIFAFMEPSVTSQQPATIQPEDSRHQDRPLYLWATVARHSTNSQQFTMKTTEGRILYTTDSRGRNKTSSLVIKRQGMMCCALLRNKNKLDEGEKQEQEQQQEPTWNCRVCPGIDVTMMMCFVACIDKLREVEWDEVRNRHGVGYYKPSRVL